MAKPSIANPLRHIIERQYSDNVVIKNKLFKERLIKARNLYRKDLLAHYGCVNAIEFSSEGDLLVSGMCKTQTSKFHLAFIRYFNPLFKNNHSTYETFFRRSR